MTPSRLILMATAAVAAVCGAALLFAPEEILRALGGGALAPPAASFALQICGGALFGFAMLNWMARGTRVGGIYARPLALANFLQWGSGAVTWSHLWRAGAHPALVVAATTAWLLCALAFAYLLFFHDPI